MKESGYNYQNELTIKLDSYSGDFNQEIINEVVLWKVNRYAQIDPDTMDVINSIDKKSTTLDADFTRKLLSELIDTKGIKLPMASTILRFKNPNVYQIIDQRVHRFIMGVELKLPYNVDDQIDLYLEYLKELKKTCKDKNIVFKDADRILYELDKKYNADLKIKY